MKRGTFWVLSFILSVAAAEQARKSRVAIMTGGARGVLRGITEALADSGQHQGFLLLHNTNKQAAESFASELKERFAANDDECAFNIQLVGGDISLEKTRDTIFHCLDKKFGDWELGALVHNAGQHVGITSDNAARLEKNQELVFGDGSLLLGGGNDKVNLEVMRCCQRMHGEAHVDLCERALERMKRAAANCNGNAKFRGSLIGISSPGCNFSQRPSLGHNMP